MIAWNTWNAYTNVTEAFLILAKSLTTISDSTMSIIRKFLVPWYDRTIALVAALIFQKINHCGQFTKDDIYDE